EPRPRGRRADRPSERALPADLRAEEPPGSVPRRVPGSAARALRAALVGGGRAAARRRSGGRRGRARPRRRAALRRAAAAGPRLVRSRLRRLLRGPRDAVTRPDPTRLDDDEWGRLAPDLLAPGPGVTGARGGSGTRVIARIMRRGGMFIGTDLNISEDALDFAAFADRWVDRYWGRGRTPDMAAELKPLAARQFADAAGAPWGWKEP